MKKSNTRWLAGMALFTLASGWIGVGLNRMLGDANSMESAGSGVWIAAPCAAVILTRLLRRSNSPSGVRPNLPSALPWYAVGVAFFPVVNAISIAIGSAAGWADTQPFEASRWISGAAAVAIPVIVKNVLEESVWRGYFTAELLNQRRSDLFIYGSVGLIWALWHLPYHLYFLADGDIAKILDVERPLFFLATLPTVLVWAVPYTEIFRRTGSIWPCILMHSAQDALVTPLFTEGHVQIADGRAWLMSPLVGLLPVVMALALGLALRARRIHTSHGVLSRKSVTGW